jgi:hypothetical protein
MTPLAVSQFLYPRIYPLTGLVGGQSTTNVNGQNIQSPTADANANGGFVDGKFEMPAQIRASFEYFCTEEAYLIENGLVAFIWCGGNVPKEWFQNVFNVASIVNLDTEKV